MRIRQEQQWPPESHRRNSRLEPKVVRRKSRRVFLYLIRGFGALSGREDVRWAELTDAEGYCIRIEGHDTLSVSALPWSEMELLLASHPHELPESSGTHVHVDTRTLGLGGASCGQGGALERDQLYAGPKRVSFIIRGISPVILR